MTETWNSDATTITNQIANDIPDIKENLTYLSNRFGYIVDPTEVDQGSAGNGRSIKDFVDVVGSTKKATLFFPHYADDGNTTIYTVSTSETIPSNISIVVQPGAILSIANGVTLTINGTFEVGLYRVFSGAGSASLSTVDTIYVDWFGETLNAAALQAAITAAPATGRVVANHGIVNIDSNVTINEKGRPDLGVFELDFTGTTMTGTGNIIFDSCKNLRIKNVQHSTGDFVLRGVWYSIFTNCRASELTVCDAAGTSYSSCYWNTFHGGVYQKLNFVGNDSFNATFFQGTVFRGDANQGFVGTVDYNIEVAGTGNMQSLNFSSGDMSYPTTGTLTISSTADIEINFDSMYFDDKTPEIGGLATNQYIRIKNCRMSGGKVFGSAELASALSGDVEINGNNYAAGWRAYQPFNMILNGGFTKELVSYLNTGGGPINTFTNGTITPVLDANIGPYINLAVGNGDSTFTLCRFKSVDLLYTGKYTGCIIARNNAAGTRSLSFAVGSQFFDADVGQNWTLINLGEQADMNAGSAGYVLMRATDGSGYDIDVRYVGLVLGTHPPMICPQHPSTNEVEQSFPNEILLGNIALASRPKMLTGTGSPEGAETAAPGSIYLNMTGGANVSIYVKESGTSNTGWVAK